MPHHKSAVKRVRQSKRRQEYNRANKKAVKVAMKDVRACTTRAEAEPKLRTAQQVLDRVVAHGVIPKNYASNKKSKLALFVASLDA